MNHLHTMWAALVAWWQRRFAGTDWQPSPQGEATERWQAEIDARLRAMEAEWRVKGRHP